MFDKTIASLITNLNEPSLRPRGTKQKVELASKSVKSYLKEKTKKETVSN